MFPCVEEVLEGAKAPILITSHLNLDRFDQTSSHNEGSQAWPIAR